MAVTKRKPRCTAAVVPWLCQSLSFPGAGTVCTGGRYNREANANQYHHLTQHRGRQLQRRSASGKRPLAIRRGGRKPPTAIWRPGSRFTSKNGPLPPTRYQVQHSHGKGNVRVSSRHQPGPSGSAATPTSAQPFLHLRSGESR